MKKQLLLVLLLPALALAVHDMKWFDLNHWRAPFYNDGRWGIDTTLGFVAAGAWPHPLHNCYVFGAGPWVGGVAGGDTYVTFGYEPNSGRTEFGPTLCRYWRQGYGDSLDHVYKHPGDWPPPLSRFPMAPQETRSAMALWSCFGDSDPVNHVVQWTAWNVAVVGDYAYLAAEYSGLRVIDISNPQSPHEEGYCDTPGSAGGVAVAGNYAYVACSEYGNSSLRIIDVSDPQDPYETGYCGTAGWAYAVAVAGDYAYVADGDWGLRIINVSDPQNPFSEGYYNTPGRAYAVAVAGSYAYVADWDYGLRIVDISNPQSPHEEGYCDTPGRAVGIAVAGSYAYVADGDWGLRIINVSNPQNPFSEGHDGTPGCDVAVAGSYAYVANGYSGLRVVDVSDPQNPFTVGYHDTPGYAYRVAVAGTCAYVADGNAGLRIVDVSNPQSPYEVGCFGPPGQQLGVDIYLSVCGFADSLARDFFFLRYEIANCSGDSLRQAYFGMMLDADIGDAVDDMTGLILDRLFLVGSDTVRVRNTGFAYDYNNVEYSGQNWQSGTPGAVAVMLLSAPDSLGLTVFKRLTIDIDPTTDPTQYLTLAGYDYRTGVYEPYDSTDLVPADKRVLLSSGPFDLAPDSTAAFWYAVIGSPFGDSAQPPSGRDTSELALRCKWARYYFDRLIGVAEQAPRNRPQAASAATIVRRVLFLPPSSLSPTSSLFSLDGRRVMDLAPGANDVSRLSPGVYFVREARQATDQETGAIRKVVVAR